MTLLLILIFASTILVEAYANQNVLEKPKKRTKKEMLDDESTEIVVGEVKSKESKWVNSTYVSQIYTFAKITIDKTERTTTNLPETIKVFYEGGTIGNTSSVAIRNPWGIIELPNEGQVKVHLVEDDRFENNYYVLGVETLDEEPNVIRGIYDIDIIEEYQLDFEWIGNYLDSYVSVDWYSVADTVPNEIVNDGWLNALDAGFDNWENDALSSMSFDFEGDRNYLTPDNGYSEVGWGTVSASCVAVTYLYPTDSWEREEFDIVFSDTKSWAVGYEANHYDVESLCTHEVGHVVGLMDLDDTGSNQVMWYEATAGSTYWQSLKTGDKAGAQYITPLYSQPTIDITWPLTYLDQYTNYEIRATGTSSGISYVKYKITSRESYTYESGWSSMTWDSGDSRWEATWNTGSLDGDYWIVVMSKKTNGMLMYDVHAVNIS